MTTRFRLAFAGMLALALTACQADGPGLTTGPAARNAAPNAAPPSAEPLALADAQTGTGWWGTDGHFYSFLFINGETGASQTVHLRDGIVYAGFQNVAGGANVTAYSGSGSIITNDFIALQSAAMATRAQDELRPPMREFRGGDRRWQRAQAIPCAAEIAGYAVASAAVIAAAAAVERNPLSSKLRGTLRGALASWALAWIALYDCMDG